MFLADPRSLYLWHLITRFGEAQMLLPAAMLAAWALLRRPEGRPMATWWMAMLFAAGLLTTASKVAFIGWGVGSAELNFTGISGHAMFAAAVYPLLLGTLASRASRGVRAGAMVAGAGLAVLVGLSRIVLGAHSGSEVFAGLFVGGAVSALALAFAQMPRALLSPLLPALVVGWFAFMPLHAPDSRTHSMLTRLSLVLSGHSVAYTRHDMLRALRRRPAAPCDASACGRSVTASVATPRQHIHRSRA